MLGRFTPGDEGHVEERRDECSRCFDALKQMRDILRRERL